MASMGAYWLKASKGKAERLDLRKKCRELSDAYKQNPLSDDGYEKDALLASIAKKAILGFFNEEVPRELPELVKAGDKETAILELETVAVSAPIRLWKLSALSASHRVVLFTDYEAVRSRS